MAAWWKTHWIDVIAVVLTTGTLFLVLQAFGILPLNRPDRPPPLVSDGVIHIVAIGPVAEGDIALTQDLLAASFHAKVIRLKPLALPAIYYDSERRQYNAEALSDYVAAATPKKATRLVALTQVDLYAKGTNFVFGVSPCPGSGSVFSTARIGSDGVSSRRRNSRLCKITVHEVCHSYGLDHCEKPFCVMCYANNLKEVDEGGLGLCEDCERRLCGITLTDAYNRRLRMKQFLEKYGLYEETVGEGVILTPP